MANLPLGECKEREKSRWIRSLSRNDAFSIERPVPSVTICRMRLHETMLNEIFQLELMRTANRPAHSNNLHEWYAYKEAAPHPIPIHKRGSLLNP